MRTRHYAGSAFFVYRTGATEWKQPQGLGEGILSARKKLRFRSGIKDGHDLKDIRTRRRASTCFAKELSDEACAQVDHLRYEAADVVYHLLVVLERFGVSIDEFAAELNNRMTDEERPVGAVRLHDEFVKRSV